MATWKLRHSLLDLPAGDGQKRLLSLVSVCVVRTCDMETWTWTVDNGTL